MKLDILVVAAHPDDAEISVGGTILRAVRAGKKVGIVDVTRGEMGTRGTQADRDSETKAAGALMKISVRDNLEQPDGRVVCDVLARERLAALIRKYRPETLLAHHTEDLHPDHVAAGQLAREAWYLSGLTKLALEGGDTSAHRPGRLYHFMGHVPFQASFVVDITSVWEEKRELIRCYKSQLKPADGQDKGQHFLFGSDILGRVESKARYWGELIGSGFGEPFFHVGPIASDDPLLGPDLGGR